jgi:hypothetical protein
MEIRRPTKTPADYLVIALSPALLIILVHSVCFFLLEVFYRSKAVTGVRWVMFWFVLAVVLITRIGIEQGDTQAVVYGLLLALATWLYLTVVQHSVFLGAVLLGLVWFTAHKLTVNCTLVDDDADASGQGLLATLGKLPKWLEKQARGNPPTAVPATTAASPANPPASPAGRSLPLAARRPASPTPPEKKKRKSSAQVPGIWLIYFSLAALPAFGVGQMLLPAGNLAARHQGFVYLFCYLAAALGLLVTTSFLGLRRYLRQRYVAMPGKIALGWIQFGAAGILVVLCASLLLPRPGAGEAWGTLRYQVDYQLRRASQYAARFNPNGQGSGRAGDQASPNAQPENPPSSSGQSPAQNPKENSGAPGDQPAGTPPSAGAPAGGGGQTEGPQPATLPATGPAYALFKTLFYLAAFAGVGWLFYRYREMILTMLRGLWAAIRNLIASLFGGYHPRPAATAARKTPVPPFRTFKNPFQTGANQIWPPEQLIAYTYAALQSWALDEDVPHSPQTPREFCRQLAAQIPDAAGPLEHLAFLYGHVAYGASVPGKYHPEHLRLLWDYLALPRPKLPPTPEAVAEGNP